VLKDFDDAINGLGASQWSDAGAYIFAKNANQVAITDSGLMGIGTSSPSYLLDVGGTAAVQALVLNGTAITASAAELNILDGATVTYDEINYLDGATAVAGGIIFGNGTNLTQDAPYLSWDNTNNRLGVGTSTPSYNLDVAGTLNTTNLYVNNIGIGNSTAATTSGAYVVGVFDEFDNSNSTRVQDVLDDLDQSISTLGYSQWTDAGSYIFANNANQVAITDTGFMGIGTSAPTQLLDVGGTAAVQALVLNGTAITARY
jgi:hypothetical protein